jgi:hypothetical protein
LIALVQFNTRIVPAWVAVLVIGREFLLPVLRKHRGGRGIQHRRQRPEQTEDGATDCGSYRGDSGAAEIKRGRPHGPFSAFALGKIYFGRLLPFCEIKERLSAAQDFNNAKLTQKV